MAKGTLHRYLGALLIAFAYILPVTAAASSDGKFEAELNKARTLYVKAVNGDKRDVRAAIRYTDALSRTYPQHPLVTVLKGCSLAARGMPDSERPANRKRYTEAGLALVDRGLAQLKSAQINHLEAVEAEVTAALLFVHLPDTIFHRLKKGEAMIDALMAQEAFDALPNGLRAAIYFATSVVAEKYGDSEKQKKFLELSLAADPDGVNSPYVRQRLFGR